VVKDVFDGFSTEIFLTFCARRSF